jgi:hypothetical protein
MVCSVVPSGIRGQKWVDETRKPLPSGPVVAAMYFTPLAFALLLASFVMAAEPRPPLRGGVKNRIAIAVSAKGTAQVMARASIRSRTACG